MRIAAWFVSLLLLTTSAFGNDQVVTADQTGKRITESGKITEETATYVEINGKKLPVYQIMAAESDGESAIRYDKQSADLLKARGEERKGNWTEAAEMYQQLARRAPESQPYLRAALDFARVRSLCQLALSDPTACDAAIAAVNEFKKAYPASRHHYPMHELLGKVLLVKGDFKNAQVAFGALRDQETADWPGFADRAETFNGLCSLRQNDPNGALRSFERVIAASKGDDRPTLARRYTAEMYKAEALLKLGKPDDAVKLLNSVLPSMAPEMEEIKAIGYNILGDALVAQKQPKRAMLEGYLWVYAVYNKNADEMARAMFELSKIFNEIGDKQKSRRMVDELQAEFPKSPWTRKLSKT